MSPLWISAEWPAPANVRTCITTRRGGCSQGPWKGFNLGSHVGDEVSHVAANRAELQRVLGCAPAWLNQTHSTHLVKADATQVLDADASWTNERNIACTVMTADCCRCFSAIRMAPVLLPLTRAGEVCSMAYWSRR